MRGGRRVSGVRLRLTTDRTRWNGPGTETRSVALAAKVRFGCAGCGSESRKCLGGTNGAFQDRRNPYNPGTASTARGFDSSCHDSETKLSRCECTSVEALTEEANFHGIN